MTNRSNPRVIELRARTYTVPTDAPESDGTIAWSSTTIVIVDVVAGGARGIGYSYAAGAAAGVVRDVLAPVVVGRDAFDVAGIWVEMFHAVRNIGRSGIAASAIAAVDVALWDLKAKLLDIPLASLLGRVRDGISAYGSGGFTSYSDEQLRDQLGGWARDGMRAVKMKVGRNPSADPERVRVARDAIGPSVELFVDANGAHTPSDALAMAEIYARQHVTWFEEPVSSDDLEGLRAMRARAPAGMRITAGEYGYDAIYFRRMLEAGAVDVLQADATRCGGVTGFMQAAALCDAFGVPLSAHTAPSLHTHLCCAAPRAINVEYFHDHARIEQMFFDGARTPARGDLKPDLSRPGLGLELKETDAQRFAVRD